MQPLDLSAEPLTNCEKLENILAVKLRKQTANKWKPFDRPVENPGQSLDRKAAAAQMTAFD